MISGIMQASDDLLYLIENILDFVKIESGKMNFVLKDFDLRKLVDAIQKMFIGYDRSTSIRFVVNMDETMHSLFVGDPQGVSRVLINLVSNAFKIH